MKIQNFGKTDLKISLLGFGAGHIGGNELSDKEADFLLNMVLDEGITLIDTARAYGLSEERIGRFISHRKREFSISTKVGYGVEGVPDWTYECVIQGIDRALKVLRTDTLDIVHLHSCPRSTLKKGEVISALEKAKQAGKVRIAAYSGENENLLYALKTNRFDSVMSSINFCDQHSVLRILPFFKDQGIGVIAKRPLANAPWRFAERPTGNYAEEYWHRWKTLNLNPAPLDWNEFAIRFVISHPMVSSLIVGTRNSKHLKENIRQVNRGPLPDDLLKQTNEVFLKLGADWKGEV